MIFLHEFSPPDSCVSFLRRVGEEAGATVEVCVIINILLNVGDFYKVLHDLCMFSCECKSFLMNLYMRCSDFPKLYSPKVFVFIVQARYWLTE